MPYIINWVLDVEKHQAARLNLGSDHDIIIGWMVDPNAPTPTPTITPLPTSTPLPGTVNQIDGAALVRIPAGPFTMGADPGSTDFWGAETPAHSITLGEFRIYQNEVTNAMYQACIIAGACPQPAKTASRTQSSYFTDAAFANYPVINVSHDAATAYCQWAGGRLPTEAEWEKAARGEDSRLHPWGNDPLDATRANSCDANCPAEHANADLNDGYADTSPVGSFSQGASPYGVGDMAGNDLEWVADWFQADYYATSPAENPAGPESGTKRVVRGGSWYNDASTMRAAARSSLNPAEGYDTVGFRCVVP
ncbi:MAG: formylglycine-generating enzyme family protein [Chloroflexota bacterium]